jgi:hypothetical protein
VTNRKITFIKFYSEYKMFVVARLVDARLMFMLNIFTRFADLESN